MNSVRYLYHEVIVLSLVSFVLFFPRSNYLIIDYQSNPITTLNTDNGITITGCQFKYHQVSSSQDVYSYTIYNENKTLIKEIPTRITPSTRAEDESYKFDSIIVNSYEDVGTFVRCHVFDPLEMKIANLSNASFPINVKREFTLILHD